MVTDSIVAEPIGSYAGAGAGVENSGADGLTRFKKGWATETRKA